MYFSKPSYIIYRDCLGFGYLTDNRNFGYDTASKSSLKVGERILSKTGSVFYSVLTEKPQLLTELAEQLFRLFQGTSFSEIITDAKDFYLELSRDGFIICSEERGEESSVRFFSYDNRTPWELMGVIENKEETHTEIDWGTSFHLTRIHVDISGLCNEHCVHCYIPDEFKRQTMSKDLFFKILEQSKSCQVLNITISGGEPMLNPNLPFFIEKCRENNFSINVLSNLTLLTDDLVYLFEKTPLLSVQTSLYSMDADTHDSITRVQGSFRKTKRAIEVLRNHNIPMRINCPVMKQNKESYQDVLEWARAHNIEADSDYMLFGCFDGSRKNLECRLSIPEVESVIREQSDDNRIQSKMFEEGDEIGMICPVCSNSLCISHMGDIYPCEGWQSFILGNVKDVLLSKIWEDSPLVKELRYLTYDDFPKCRFCMDKDYCSICLIRNANESENHDFRDINTYFCEVAKLKRRIRD